MSLTYFIGCIPARWAAIDWLPGLTYHPWGRDLDAIDVAKVCIRRWYVFLPILSLAIGSALGLASARAAQYSASGGFALVYDQAVKNQPLREDPRSYNPLAANGGQLLSEALIAELNGPDAQRELGDRSTRGQDSTKGASGAAYSVQLPDNSESIVVSAFSADGRAALATVDRVMAAATTRARAIQARAGAPAESQLSVFVTVPAQVTVLPPPSKSKLILAISGVGGLAGAALSLLVDRLLTRRQERRPTMRGFVRDRRARAATTTWEPVDDMDESAQEPGSPSAVIAVEGNQDRAASRARPLAAESTEVQRVQPRADTSRDRVGDGSRETVRT